MVPTIRPPVAAILLLLAAGCVTAPRVRSTALRTGPERPPSGEPAAISAAAAPGGAQELGLVEAWAELPVGLDAVLSEFRARVAELGGDHGLIDRATTTHETVLVREEHECGGWETSIPTAAGAGADGPFGHRADIPVTVWVSRTCVDERLAEVATLRLAGRSLRTGGAAGAAGELAGPVDYVLTGAPGAGAEVVQVVRDGDPVRRDFQEVALLAVSGTGPDLGLVDRLRARAATLGCDAVLRVRVDRGSQSATATGVAVRLR